jgi:hypothetical protein
MSYQTREKKRAIRRRLKQDRTADRRIDGYFQSFESLGPSVCWPPPTNVK